MYGPGAVNINTTTPGVLRLLGLETRTVDKIMSYRYGQDGQELTGDDRFFLNPDSIVGQLQRNVPPLDKMEEVTVTNLVSTGKLGTASNYFHVRARAVLDKDGTSLEAEAVLDRKAKVYYFHVSKMQSAL